MTKLEEAAKAYAEAHAWERKCSESRERARLDFDKAPDDHDRDEFRRYKEADHIQHAAVRATMAATARLMRVARGEE